MEVTRDLGDDRERDVDSGPGAARGNADGPTRDGIERKAYHGVSQRRGRDEQWDLRHIADADQYAVLHATASQPVDHFRVVRREGGLRGRTIGGADFSGDRCSEDIVV